MNERTDREFSLTLPLVPVRLEREPIDWTPAHALRLLGADSAGGWPPGLTFANN